ncbi:hypothetical protein I7I48_08127 [Histoplasma ohiense]|nr:hypothetical protein I7I48_08127 [Histoplasma ohiense (nom. inval.)]
MHPLIHYVHIHFIQCFLFLVILSLYINFTFSSQFCLFSVNPIERLFYFIRYIFLIFFDITSCSAICFSLCRYVMEFFGNFSGYALDQSIWLV